MINAKGQIRYIFIMAGTVVLALILFLLCNRYDNKYTRHGVQPSNGVLILDEQTLSREPIMLLIGGWEIYRDRLLSPDDFTENHPRPDEYVFIGQYGGFEAGDKSNSPHGSATYRLNIFLPQQEARYMLELPEIFSAYKLYINGKLESQFGEPEPQIYRAETGNPSIAFKAAGHVEIIVAVSDFSHFYSGMVYPPAFGEPEAVSRLLFIRFAFRMLICAIALVIGVLSLFVGAFSKNARLTALYGLSCLLYVGYVCYPIVLTLIRSSSTGYVLEHFCFTAMLLTVMFLQRGICNIKSKWTSGFIGFGVFMCVLALLSNMLITGNLLLMTVYSYMIAAYKYTTAAYLTITAGIAIYKRAWASRVMLTGLLVFDCALLMDRIIPVFEPIRFGWLIELAGLFLILSIGVVMAFSVAEQYRERIKAEERALNVSKLVEMQRGYYPMMVEKINEIKAVQHDLRHHMLVIRSFVDCGEYQKLSDYVTAWSGEFRKDDTLNYCAHYVTDVILHHYAGRAETLGIRLAVKCGLSKNISISDADICAVLSNLLENAIEACSSVPYGERWISVMVAQEKCILVIDVENSFDGFIQTRENRFLSRKEHGREGVLNSMLSLCLGWKRTVFQAIIALLKGNLKKHGGFALWQLVEQEIFNALSKPFKALV